MKDKGAQGAGLSFMELPYRGPVYDLKDSDPEEKQPQLEYQSHTKQFDMNDPEQVTEYEKVNQTIVNGTAVLSYEERVYDESIKSWRILVCWHDMYYHCK